MKMIELNNMSLRRWNRRHTIAAVATKTATVDHFEMKQRCVSEKWAMLQAF